MCRATDMLKMLGIRPIWVPNLGDDALIFIKQKIALIDEEADRDAVADEVLDLVTRSLGGLDDPVGV